MSLPVTFSYKATALNADPDGDYFWEIEGGLFDGLTTKGTDSSPPSHDGVFARPRRLLRRRMLLRGKVTGATPSAFYTAMEQMVTLFDLKSHGDLVAVLPNGATYTLDVRPINFMAGMLLTDILARPTVELHSYDDADWEIEAGGS